MSYHHTNVWKLKSKIWDKKKENFQPNEQCTYVKKLLFEIVELGWVVFASNRHNFSCIHKLLKTAEAQPSVADDDPAESWDKEDEIVDSWEDIEAPEMPVPVKVCLAYKYLPKQ